MNKLILNLVASIVTNKFFINWQFDLIYYNVLSNVLYVMLRKYYSIIILSTNNLPKIVFANMFYKVEVDISTINDEMGCLCLQMKRN